ncbi:MAG: iron uptake protein [Thauera sp.]|nr:iron uptake protein [Thauera sp.]
MSAADRSTSGRAGSPLTVVARIAAAVLGGYAFTWGVTALGTVLLVALGTDFHEAETAMLLLAFLVFLGVFLWAFAAPRLVRVWAVLGGGAVLMLPAAWWLQQFLLS